MISSGSVGNAYLLTSNTGQRLLLDCGVASGKLKVALDFDLSDLYCLCLHRHFDHCKSVSYLTDSGIDVFTTADVVELFGNNE